MVLELELAAYQGLEVDLIFRGAKPSFGDLFVIVNDEHPRFPPSGDFGFDRLADLGFRQVDDVFGVPNSAGDGADVCVWLFPVVNGREVFHQPGPFSAIRLAYSVLRNPTSRLQTFLAVFDRFVQSLDVEVHYVTRGVRLPPAEARKCLSDDTSQIIEYWIAEGIEPGSDEALMLDF